MTVNAEEKTISENFRSQIGLTGDFIVTDINISEEVTTIIIVVEDIVIQIKINNDCL